jgi:hypothetical protein
MSETSLIPILFAAAGIAVLVILLASTRKSLSGPDQPIGDGSAGESKYPSGFWITIGLTVGIVLGLMLGLWMHAVLGGVSIGIGVGLLIGKWLVQRYDPDTTPYTAEQQQARLRRATWGVVVMIILILATLAAALLPLLD